MIPALTVVLILGVVLACVQLAMETEDRTQPAYAPSMPQAIDEGLAWRRYHSPGKQIESVLIGRPPKALAQRMSAQVAA